MLFSSLGVCYQFQRVINAINKFNGYLKQSNLEAYERNRAAIQKLRGRQFSPIMLLAFVGFVVFALLSADIIPWTWEFILGVCGGSEVVGSTVVEFYFKRRLKQVESAQNATTETPTLPYL